MLKFPVVALLTALVVSLLLKIFLLAPHLPLPTGELWWNSLPSPSLFLLTATVYLLTYRSADFPGLLLAVAVIRLLISLTYVLVLSFLAKPIFQNMALHFLCDFAIYTAADIWLADKLLKKRCS
jgi:hypothetical protein